MVSRRSTVCGTYIYCLLKSLAIISQLNGGLKLVCQANSRDGCPVKDENLSVNVPRFAAPPLVSPCREGVVMGMLQETLKCIRDSDCLHWGPTCCRWTYPSLSNWSVSFQCSCPSVSFTLLLGNNFCLMFTVLMATFVEFRCC